MCRRLSNTSDDGFQHAADVSLAIFLHPVAEFAHSAAESGTPLHKTSASI